MEWNKGPLKIVALKADIHTYTPWFMEIQQHEKESLAAYIYHIYQFKIAAKRCNFTNDVATIWIFIKSLKDVDAIA